MLQTTRRDVKEELSWLLARTTFRKISILAPRAEQASAKMRSRCRHRIIMKCITRFEICEAHRPAMNRCTVIIISRSVESRPHVDHVSRSCCFSMLPDLQLLYALLVFHILKFWTIQNIKFEISKLLLHCQSVEFQWFSKLKFHEISKFFDALLLNSSGLLNYVREISPKLFGEISWALTNYIE